MVAGITPIDSSGGLGKHLNPAIAEQNNASIAMIAKERGLSLIGQQKQMTDEKLTVNGVHLDACAYKEWEPAILGGLGTELGCSIAGN
ncbi:hypothetical protein [Bradyrhizobium sp. RT3b]|uniref:hypothetical protein n=1 Tax=Bradyrhizobium sp. RT3b TaxID=3156334 RepID=UPI0033955A07